MSLVELFKKRCGYHPDLDNPTTFCEKALWSKIHIKDSRMVYYGDKYRAKKLIEGESEAKPIPSVDFNSSACIVKLNNYSGKSTKVYNTRQYKSVLNHYTSIMNDPYGQEKGEWFYGEMKPIIYCEPILNNFTEIKFFCFNGSCEYIYYVTETGKTFLKDGRRPVKSQQVNGSVYPSTDQEIPGDVNVDKMKSCAEKLSKEFPHVRVDLIWHEGTIYYTEHTFYHFSGMLKFNPKEFDKELGSYWKI